MEKLTILLLMIFWLLVCNTLVMMDMNVAIVSMTRPIPEEKSTNNKSFICPNTTFFRRDIQYDTLMTLNSTQKDTYNWNNYEKRMVLSAFHWLAWLTVLPSGIAAQKYGSKIVVGYSLCISSIMSSIIPYIAEYGPRGVMWVRMVQGLLITMTLPGGIMNVTGNWSSVENRGKFVAAVLGGLSTSLCFGSYLFGYIGRYVHWKYIFHLTSFCGILWTIGWYFLIFDSPTSHPTISEKEKNKILQKRKCLTENGRIPIPWKEILTFFPLSLCYLNSGASILNMFVLTTYMPLYLNDMFGFDSNQSGIIISSYQMIGVVVVLGHGWFTDYFLKKKWLSVTNTRKLFAAFGCVSSSTPLILMAFAKCDVIATLVYSVLSASFRYTLIFGIEPAVVDISPNFCGVTHGLMGTVSELMTLAFSMGMAYLTKIMSTEKFWKTVFLLSATLNIIPSALFTIWGTAELQPWNQGPCYYRNGVNGKENPSDPLKRSTDSDEPVL